MTDPTEGRYSYDLVSLGEVMLRLSPPGLGRLRQARSLAVHVAGSQLNVAANLARLDKRAAFITKLPDNDLGLLARDTCSGYGVDMSHAQGVPGARIGVNYVEFSQAPRPLQAIYDRAGSAASTTAGDDFDWKRILTGARVAHTDGIFPGLSKTTEVAALEFLRTAKEAGCTTSFDVNYREHLWNTKEARDSMARLLPQVDILVTNRTASIEIFGYRGDDGEMMRSYRDEFGAKIVCFTARTAEDLACGAWSSKALHGDQLSEGQRFEFDIVDRFGTGDAWVAGFIYGYLEQGVRFGLDFGNALCALAHTIEGDVAHVRADEVLALLSDGHDLRLRR